MPEARKQCDVMDMRLKLASTKSALAALARIAAVANGEAGVLNTEDYCVVCAGMVEMLVRYSDQGQVLHVSVDRPDACLRQSQQ